MIDNESKIKQLADAVRETTEAAEKLSDAIDKAIRETLVEVDGTAYTLPDALRAYRGGNYLVTKWRKCADQMPKAGESVVFMTKWGSMRIGEHEGCAWQVNGNEWYKDGEVTHWMKCPLPPKPERGAINGNDTADK